MSDSQVDYIFKYIIIGNACVGKSNLLLRYVNNIFQEKYQVTIGLEFAYKTISIQNTNCKIQIWDTAGMECFRSISRGYYKNSCCAVIVYDISNRESFNKVKDWVEECVTNSSKSIYLILVGNKIDLPEENRNVSTEEGNQLAEKYGMKFYETSAKTGEGVANIFEESAGEIVKRINNNYYDLDDEKSGIRKSLNKRLSLKKKNSENNNNKKKKKKCC